MLDSSFWIGSTATILTLLFAFVLGLPFLVLYRLEAQNASPSEQGVTGGSIASMFVLSIGFQYTLLGIVALITHSIASLSTLEFRFALGLMMCGMILSLFSLATWNIFLSGKAQAQSRGRIVAGTLGINAAIQGLLFALVTLLCTVSAVTTELSKRWLVASLCYLVATIVTSLFAVRESKDA